MQTSIAVTNLDFVAAIKLLCYNGHTILFYKKSTPDFLYNMLKNKHNVIECSVRTSPEYFENIENEKEKFNIATQVVADSQFFIKESSKILGIRESHIRNALTKHFVKLLSDDITFINLTKAKNSEYWLENHDFIRKFAYKNLASKGQLNIFNILSTCYLSVWPFYLVAFIINNFRKDCGGRKKTKIIFQQIYAKRFGHDPQFDAFFRYFKTRGDVAYYCLKKNDEIYKAVRDFDKPAFSSNNLRMPLREVLTEYHILLRLVILIFSQNIFHKILYLRIGLKIFKEYVITKAIMMEFSPKYFIRVRPELYENHPIATGVCESFGCSNIGYEHSPPVHFIANYALSDFHYYGVVGKLSMTSIYKEHIINQKWAVLGPITAEVCYDIPVQADSKAILLIADYFIYKDVKPFESYVDDVLFPLLDFMKGKGMKLIYRLKTFQNKGRGSRVKSICEKYNVECSVEYQQQGRDLKGFCAYTLMKVGLVVVRGSSTVAYESLALGKKLILFHNNWCNHPFELFLPNLVAKNGEELHKKMQWLLNISYFEYIKEIEHIIDQNAKKANGRMVQEFFESFVKVDG